MRYGRTLRAGLYLAALARAAARLGPSGDDPLRGPAAIVKGSHEAMGVMEVGMSGTSNRLGRDAAVDERRGSPDQNEDGGAGLRRISEEALPRRLFDLKGRNRPRYAAVRLLPFFLSLRSSKHHPHTDDLL